MLVLGDVFFTEMVFSKILQETLLITKSQKKSTVFGYYVTDPENFGVVEFDDKDNPINIVEKPKKFKK